MQPDALLDRLLLLTLTLEDAVRREDFQEMDSLFRQRDRTLDALEPLKIPNTHPTVQHVMEADRRLGLILATRSQETVAEIRRTRAHGKAQRAYSHAA